MTRLSVVVVLSLLAVGACLADACRVSSPGQPAGSNLAPTSPLPHTTSLASPIQLPAGVLASIPLDAGSAPTAVADGFGSIWVASHRGNYLYRIDPSSSAVVARIDVGQESCGPLLMAFERVWVGHCDTGNKTIAVDPAINQVVGSFEGSPGPAAQGALWGTSNSFDAILRLDPTAYRVAARIAVKGVAMAYGAGVIWVLDANPITGDYSGLISKIDPVTNKVLGTVTTSAGRYDLATFAFGALWLKGVDDNTLLRVDPITGVTRVFEISNWTGLSQFLDEFITAGATSLWLRSSDAAVSQIDPTNGNVIATYPADVRGGGGYVAVAFGSLWVANFGSDTLWRDRLPE